MKYLARVTMLEYGFVEVDAASEEEAKEMAEIAVSEGKVMWHDEEITDVTVEKLQRKRMQDRGAR